MAVLLSNIGCDQISKNIVRQRIDYYERIELVNSHVTLTKIENSGAFLSLGDSMPAPLKILFLNILPVLMLVLALFYILFKTSLSRLTLVGICCVIGGGVGNLYDRIMFGSVTDFVHIDFVLFETGIFNMADVSIMAGMFIILLDSFLNRSGQNQPGPDQPYKS